MSVYFAFTAALRPTSREGVEPWQSRAERTQLVGTALFSYSRRLLQAPVIGLKPHSSLPSAL